MHRLIRTFVLIACAACAAALPVSASALESSPAASPATMSAAAVSASASPALSAVAPALVGAGDAPRVAIVWSQASYDVTMPPFAPGATQTISLGGPLYDARVRGVESVLAAEFGAVDRIDDAALADLAVLEQYDCVVLVRQIALTRDQRLTLRDYVARGGSLVCSFGTGRWDYDPTRTVRPFYPLVFLAGSSLWEWGEFSETMQVGFVNDPPMIGGFHVQTHPGGVAHPIVQWTVDDLGLASLDMTAPVSDCCELVRTLPAAPGFASLLMYGGATIRDPDGSRHAVSGSLAGWASNYHLGRVVYFGFQLHDMVRGGSYGSPETQAQAERLMVNSVRWAAGDRRHGAVLKSPTLSLTGGPSRGKLSVTASVRNSGNIQLNGLMCVELFDRTGTFRGGGPLRSRTTLWPGSTSRIGWLMNPKKTVGRWTARYTFTYYDYFRGGEAVARQDAYFSCDGRTFRLIGVSVPRIDGALPAPGPAVGGLDRYEVAAGVAATGWPSGIGEGRTVVLATGLSPSDALAAASVAGAYHAPLLLTPPRGLPGKVSKEITRLFRGEPTATLVFVGDTTYLPARIVSQAVYAVRGAGVTGTVSTIRLAGLGPAGTAAAVAGRVRAPADGPFADTVFIVNAAAYADALSVAPIAAKHRVPILYVGYGVIPVQTQAALASLGVKHAVIAGGPGSVSPLVEAWLERMGYRVADQPDNAPGPDTRLWGATRYDVSASAVRWSVSYAGMDPGSLGVASGLKWPDSLSAGPLLARRETPALLVHGVDVNLSPPSAQALADRRGGPTTFTFFGGPATMPAFVRGQAGELATR